MRFIICDKTEYIMGEVSMSFRKKISLSVISAVCVFAFVACGDNTSMPKCGDKDVQEKFREEVLGDIIASRYYYAELSEEDIGNIAKNVRLHNIITEESDEAGKKVTCKANLKVDSSAAANSMYLVMERVNLFQNVLEPREKITEKNYEEIIMRGARKLAADLDMDESQAEFGAMGLKLQYSEDAFVNKMEEKEIKYTAQRTDDGNLIVKEIEDYYE